MLSFKNNLLKKIIKLIKWLLITLTISLVILFFYTKRLWKDFITEKEIDELVYEIKSSKELPQKLYEIYEIEYPKSLTKDANLLLLNSIISNEVYHKNPSIQLIQISGLVWKKSLVTNNFYYKLIELSLTWKIEEKTTQKECLNWVAEHYDFTNNIKNIQNASIFYFNKNLENLNESELIGLIVLMKNPRLYNPIRQKERYETKVNQILMKLKKD